MHASSSPISARTIFPSGEEEYLLIVEKMAAPIGGVEAILKKISFPEEAQKKRLTGKVYLMLYVNQEGEVDDVVIVKGIGCGCDEEVMKAVKKSKFSPGMDKGVAVKTKMSMAIPIKLS